MKRILLSTMPIVSALCAVILLFTCIHFPVFANDSTDDIRLRTYVPVLTSSPSVCELTNDRRICRLTASLLWEVPKAGNYCLYFLEKDEYLQCWENEWAGVFPFNMYATSDAHFYLTRGRGGTVAAKATIAVLGKVQQQENADNRKGFWRIF